VVTPLAFIIKSEFGARQYTKPAAENYTQLKKESQPYAASKTATNFTNFTEGFVEFVKFVAAFKCA
jgi:hypothetical protein